MKSNEGQPVRHRPHAACRAERKAQGWLAVCHEHDQENCPHVGANVESEERFAGDHYWRYLR